jgi:hypothetical protein
MMMMKMIIVIIDDRCHVCLVDEMAVGECECEL